MSSNYKKVSKLGSGAFATTFIVEELGKPSSSTNESVKKLVMIFMILEDSEWDSVHAHAGFVFIHGEWTAIFLFTAPHRFPSNTYIYAGMPTDIMRPSRHRSYVLHSVSHIDTKPARRYRA